MNARPRAYALAASALLLAGCAATPTATPVHGVVPHPDVTVRERTVHYPVIGATVAELASTLDEDAPTVEGRRFRGATHWNVRWRLRYAPSGVRCVVTDVDVDLEVTITVPRREPHPDADPDLALRWAAYRSALDVHEAGHRDLAVAAANEVRRALAGLSTPGCGAIVSEANARGHWVVERYRQRNRRYDRETDHGRTQGAIWPPPHAQGGSVHAGSPER